MTDQVEEISYPPVSSTSPAPVLVSEDVLILLLLYNPTNL